MRFHLSGKAAARVAGPGNSSPRSRFPASPRLFAVLLAILPSAATAATNEPGRYVLAATNVVADQLFAFAPTVDLAGTVADDAVVLAGVEARLSGTVSNDLWMAAGQGVEVSGSVGDHARLAAALVDVSGHFGRSLSAAGREVHLATNSLVAEDVNLAGYSVALEGRVGSNATLVAMRTATIGGHIGGSVRVTAEDISVLPNTKIDGDLVYVSSKELFLDRSVVLGGKLTHEPPRTVPAAELATAQFAGTVIFAFSAMLAGTLFVVVFPRFTGNSARLLRQATWRCLFTGAFAMPALLLMALLALFSGVVLPLGVVLLSSFGLLLYLGNLLVALALGGLLLRQHGPQPAGHAILSLALGVVVLYVLKAMPFVGFFLALAAWFAGTGALLLNLFHSQRTLLPQQPPPLPGAQTMKKED